ncbi:MAG TPA: hypothetical protein ENK86_05285, partial [Campylobacterales bacterium]|nr:hypothetical protein [Campylobacterales bacterium]
MYLIKALLLVSFFSTLLFSKGEVSKIYAHHENAADTTYTANGKKHKWGKGKNLVIDGFEYNGKRYDYVSDSPIVKIRRVNNDASSGEPCGLFAERKNGDSYKLEPAFPQSSGNCDMAKAMAGRVINVGALDLFRNVGYTAKNVERVDFISPNGLYAPSQSSKLSEAGHVVTEKSGNNYLQIAAILSIDANNNPTSFGPLVMIHKNNDDSSNIRYGMTTIYLPDNSSIYHQQLGFYVDNTSGDQGEPWWIQNSNEALGMAFVSLDDLGVNAGQKYYGFAYFGRDVTSAHTLTNINTFPKNTGGDTADPYGGVASYFVTEEIAKVSISDASIEEGDSGTKKLYFEVTLDKPAPNGGVTVQVQPHNESANEGEDYTRHTSSISFAQGESTKQIYYLINGDTDVEVDETFKVELHNPQNAVLAQSEAIGTIINDDTEDNSCHVPLFEDNFNNGLSDSWRVLKAEGGYTPAVTNNRLRLTNRTHDLSTASTIDYEFPTANNKFILEFDYYSYGGCSDNNNYVSGQAGKYGADGLSIVLFDSSVGREPKPGASGGSLGYANGYIEMHDGSHKQQAGFEKGWLGIGIDEFGCFKINDEGRRDIDGNSLSNNDEPNNEQPNTIAIRGGESTGYRLLESTNTLSSPVARQSVKDNGKLKDNANNSFKSGQYRLVVDSLNDANLYITLERKLDGGDWEVVIEKFDAMESKYHQGAKPEKFRIAFSSGTGGGCNNHEIDNVRVCSKGEEYTEEPPKISINNVEKYEGNSGRTNFIFTASLDKPVPQLSNDEETGFWYTVTDGSDGNESEYSGAYVVDSHLDDPQEQDVYGDARWIELPVGATEFNITVEVKGDTIIEPDERFFLDLYAPSNLEWDASCVTTDANGDTQCRAEGIILNDDESITPIAEYRFDECRWIGAKGEVRDNSVNGLHGRAQGEATTVTEGIIGRAGYFDGDQDYVEIANSEQLQLTENATFAFW